MASSMNLEITNPLFILAHMAKITEETGELSDCVLSELGFQRPPKLAAYNSEELQKEFADVIISTLLLGTILGIDIDQAISDKLEIIMSRDYAHK